MIWLPFLFFLVPPRAVAWSNDSHAEENTCSQLQRDSRCFQPQLCEQGDVMLAIFVNSHSHEPGSATRCNVMYTTDVQDSYAAKFILDQLTKSSYIPGVRLGTVMMDACNDPEVTIQRLVQLRPHLTSEFCQHVEINGILSGLTSPQSMAVANALSGTAIPVIAFTSTATSLDDKERYPTFIRTIPSDAQQIAALITFVKKLDWVYVALVHTEDAYGQEGASLFTQRAGAAGICIASTDLLTTNYDLNRPVEIIENLVDTASTTKNGTLGVVYIGQLDGAKGLVRASSNVQNSNRLIWVMSDGVGADNALFRNHQMMGVNTFSVTPNYNQISEFKTHWLQLLHNVKRSPNVTEESVLLRKYISAVHNCEWNAAPQDDNEQNCADLSIHDLDTRYKESSYLNTMLDAVYAWAHTIKRLHTRLCGRSHRGVCPDLKQALSTKASVEILKTDFTYPADFSYLPSALSTDRKRLQFNETTGNIIQDRNLPAFLIHKYTCSAYGVCEFKEIAEYFCSLNQLSFTEDQAHISVYPLKNPNTAVSLNNLGPIFCNVGCKGQCTTPPQSYGYVHIPGEFLIGSFLPVHNKCQNIFMCHPDIRMGQSVQLLEALIYAVKVFNDRHGPYGNHPLCGKLGLIAFDSCYSSIKISQTLVRFHSKQDQFFDQFENAIDPDKVVAYISGFLSGINLKVVDILYPLNLTQVSYGATSTALYEHESILATVPADDIQTKAIMEIVSHQGWKSVSILFRNDAYGKTGASDLVRFAKKSRICLAVIKHVSVDLSKEEAFEVLDHLLFRTGTKAVILFMGWQEAKTIITAASEKHNKKQFVWIGTESWANREAMLHPDIKDEALGSITIGPDTVPDDDLKRHIELLDPRAYTSNPFYKQYFEQKMGCRLPNSMYNRGEMCKIFNLGKEYIGEPLERFAKAAVFATAIGIGDALKKVCPNMDNCEELTEADAQKQIYKSIKNVRLDMMGNGQVKNVFSDRGDGTTNYRIYNIQKEAKDSTKYIYKKVGVYNRESGLILSKNNPVVFYDSDGQEIDIESRCFHTDCSNCSDERISSKDALTKNAFQEGEALIINLMSLHIGAPETNPSLFGYGLRAFETFKWAIDRINEDKTILPRTKLGYLIVDTFNTPEMAAWHTTGILGGGRGLYLKDYTIDAKKMALFFTGCDDDITLATMQITQKHQGIVHIDTGGSISSLFEETEKNRNFVASNINIKREITVLAKLVNSQKWKHIQFVYTDSSAGHDVKNVAKEIFASHDICIVNDKAVNSRSFDHSYNELVEDLFLWGSRGADVVIVYLEKSQTSKLANTYASIALERKSPKLVFVGGWEFTSGVREVKGIPHQKQLEGSIIISPDQMNISNQLPILVQYLKDLSINYMRNPWFSRAAWDTTMDDFPANDPVVEKVLRSLWIAAGGLHKILDAYCPHSRGLCQEYLNLADRDVQLKQHIKWMAENQQTQSNIFNLTKSDKDSFSIKILTGTPGETTWKTIGKFESGRIELNDQLFKEYGSISGTCTSQECSICDLKQETKPENIYFWAFIGAGSGCLLMGMVLIVAIHRIRKTGHYAEPVTMVTPTRQNAEQSSGSVPTGNVGGPLPEIPNYADPEDCREARANQATNSPQFENESYPHD